MLLKRLVCCKQHKKFPTTVGCHFVHGDNPIVRPSRPERSFRCAAHSDLLCGLQLLFQLLTAAADKNAFFQNNFALSSFQFPPKHGAEYKVETKCSYSGLISKLHQLYKNYFLYHLALIHIETTLIARYIYSSYRDTSGK